MIKKSKLYFIIDLLENSTLIKELNYLETNGNMALFVRHYLS